ncbi:MAG: pitrilysin family protein [Methylococcales bacterium]
MNIIKPSTFTLFILVLVTLIPFQSVHASEYSQPGFYDVHHYVLENGLRVSLKPRHLARNVSIRLLVNIGHDHFTCGKRETAYFLEHLLFTGTSKNSENELDDIIESHGGGWNAKTSTDYTMYEIDIYNKYMDVALNVLNEIITDSVLSTEDVEKSRNIINREAGGRPSELRNWLHEKGVIASSLKLAMKDLLPNRRVCDGIDQSTSVTREDIVSAYKTYYIPNNMTLSIVGDFDIASATKLIKDTMGLMKKDETTKRYVIPIPETNKSLDTTKVYEGQFSPLFGTDTTVYQIYRIPSDRHKDFFVFEVLEEYFNREMYQLLRVEKGLAYSPGAESGMFPTFGIFLLATDSEIEHANTNITLISQIIEKFKKGDLNQDELNETKQKILLGAARGYETNQDFAEYYANNDYEIKELGALINYEVGVEKVTLADIQRVSLKYFNEDNRVIAITSPTLTYTQLYSLIIVMIAIISLLTWRMVLRFRRKGNKKNVEYL